MARRSSVVAAARNAGIEDRILGPSIWLHSSQAPRAFNLASFDRYLTERHLRFERVVIGGAALNLLGVVSRITKDCDILTPEIPKQIDEASRAFARQVRATGGTLQDEWFNSGPASLRDQLLPGWEGRLQAAFVGQAIHLHTLGREDLLCAKLFAPVIAASTSQIASLSHRHGVS
jgi:hypothetical protein